MVSKTLYIGVLGPTDCSQEIKDMAEEVGRLIAGESAILVCGGGAGVAEASARGSSEAGGISVGILADADRKMSPDGLTVSIPTGLGEGRNFLIIRASDAAIAIGASWGTISEIALACRTGVPLISLMGPQIDWKGEKPGDIIYVMTPVDAVKKAIIAGRKRRKSI
ncbi:MAG: hypothetical protein J7M18_08020 [Candidatus Eremiobacteraeota bacterium]|nr:hypothetical protein [Candidatus Eremiobacteraeota bacterium]